MTFYTALLARILTVRPSINNKTRQDGDSTIPLLTESSIRAAVFEPSLDENQMLDLSSHSYRIICVVLCVSSVPRVVLGEPSLPKKNSHKTAQSVDINAGSVADFELPHYTRVFKLVSVYYFSFGKKVLFHRTGLCLIEIKNLNPEDTF
ncbi:Hypothetical predicted protein [Cloeon dipterum]|uniref:Uncharacterized protein n=1 Tax=Cloeon dipterum TaxID=197152 RepID=A0A8S1C126_9INSE|nr:Hypothetical predicted protein [Cloeon dipterum]